MIARIRYLKNLRRLDYLQLFAKNWVRAAGQAKKKFLSDETRRNEELDDTKNIRKFECPNLLGHIITLVAFALHNKLSLARILPLFSL